MLANDPHLGFSAPTIWYLARLELETGGVIGGTFPGSPTVLVGRSDTLGWGLTNSYADDQDVFLEKVNPENREQVDSPTGWKTLRSRQSIIQVKDAEPIPLTLRWSDNGPILESSQLEVGSITPVGHVAALSWSALSDKDTSIQSLLKIMRSQSVNEALAAGEDFVAAAQNLVVVDRENAAMKVIGKLPRRAARHQTQGRLPAPEPANWRALDSFCSRPANENSSASKSSRAPEM